MGWRTTTGVRPASCTRAATRRVVWLLPAPVRTAHTEMTGRRLAGRGGRGGGGGGVHARLVGHVAIGEHDLVHRLLADEPLELLLGDDGDAVRVAPAGECGGGPAPGAARGLGRRGGH